MKVQNYFIQNFCYKNKDILLKAACY